MMIAKNLRQADVKGIRLERWVHMMHPDISACEPELRRR